MTSAEELAEMERLSSSFVPVQTGDLVSHKTSTSRLTEEYAKADPIYAGKTKLLPLTYPLYRTVRGDGNCGFRALAFGYLESLAFMASEVKYQTEIERLRSLNSMLDETGQESFMYEDFVDATLELLAQLAKEPSPESEDGYLLRAFNDPDVSNATTQHFRMLTSAKLKLDSVSYQPFVPDEDIVSYTQRSVDPFGQEIEHVSVKALVESVINPAGISVECIYLDRSPGTEATLYSFPAQDEAEDPLGGAPTIRLLYRPGHYDLLYKAQDEGKPRQDNIEVGPDTKDASVTKVLAATALISMRQGENTMECFLGLPGFDPNADFQARASDGRENQQDFSCSSSDAAKAPLTCSSNQAEWTEASQSERSCSDESECTDSSDDGHSCSDGSEWTETAPVNDLSQAAIAEEECQPPLTDSEASNGAYVEPTSQSAPQHTCGLIDGPYATTHANRQCSHNVSTVQMGSYQAQHGWYNLPQIPMHLYMPQVTALGSVAGFILPPPALYPPYIIPSGLYLPVQVNLFTVNPAVTTYPYVAPDISIQYPLVTENVSQTLESWETIAPEEPTQGRKRNYAEYANDLSPPNEFTSAYPAAAELIGTSQAAESANDVTGAASPLT